MGVAESKVLAESVLNACERAERQGESKLDDESLWRDEVILQVERNVRQMLTLCFEAILKAARKIYRYIPPEFRSKPRQSNLRKAISRSHAHAHMRIPQVVDDVRDKREVLFPKARDMLEREQTGDPQAHSINLSTGPTSSIDHLARYYTLVVQFETQDYLNKIRLRILYVAFYQVNQKLQPRVGYEQYGTVSFLAEAIFRTLSGKGSLDDIKRRLRTWIGYGERYTLIAEDLGGLGALYILPDLGGEYIWTKELPKSATKQGRISMIKSLKGMNIHVEAERRGLHASAQAEVKRIVQDFIEAVESATNSHLPGIQNFQTGQDQRRRSVDVVLQRDASTEILPTSRASSTDQFGFVVPPSHVENIGWLENRHIDQAESSGNNNPQNTVDSLQHIQNMSDIRQPSQVDQPTMNQPHQPLAGGEYLDFTTMTPTNYPQVFPLPPTTMRPFDHPQVFLDQYASMFPMNYPQLFPFQEVVPVSMPRLGQERPFVRETIQCSHPSAAAFG